MAEPLRFARGARRPGALALLGAGLALLAALIFLVEAHPLAVALLALLLAPALWDAIRNTQASVEIDDTHLKWRSGRRGADVPLDRIEEAVLATTLDFSQRLRLRLKGGESQRVPPECLPPGRALDAAFTARGIPHKRSLFSF